MQGQSAMRVATVEARGEGQREGDADHDKKAREDQVGGGGVIPEGVTQLGVDRGIRARVGDQDHAGDRETAQHIEGQQALRLGFRGNAGVDCHNGYRQAFVYSSCSVYGKKKARCPPLEAHESSKASTRSRADGRDSERVGEGLSGSKRIDGTERKLRAYYDAVAGSARP